jgi:Family of unknown function (DUF6152)
MKLVAWVVLLAVGSVSPPSAFAHHGVSLYDYKKTVIAKVTVTRYDWTNPHCKIHFEAADDTGKIEHWVIEAHPPGGMMEHGWTRQSLHAGDEITIQFRPDKDGAAGGLLVKALLPDGLELSQNLLLLPPGDVYSLEQWQKVRAKMP